MDPKQLAQMAESTPEYEAFVDKFKLKKTTDDCYTPANVYDVVADYVAKTYNLDREKFVRPFYPGGDYEHEEYPAGCVVVDNPPFSMITKIAGFFLDNGIRFFLFAPGLTTFGPLRKKSLSCVCTGCGITYENGATVRTSFITNLEDCAARTAPDLFRMVEDANAVNQRELHADLPKYAYPDNVATAAMLNQLSRYGVDYRISRDESCYIGALDAQKANGKTVFGGGLLLSEKAAAEKAAAEKAAAEKAAAEKKNAIVWELSERERRIVAELSRADAVA